jgi:hypothetical protein
MITQSYHQFCRKLVAQYHGLGVGTKHCFFSANVNVKLTSLASRRILAFLYIFFLFIFNIFLCIPSNCQKNKAIVFTRIGLIKALCYGPTLDRLKA